MVTLVVYQAGISFWVVTPPPDSVKVGYFSSSLPTHEEGDGIACNGDPETNDAAALLLDDNWGAAQDWSSLSPLTPSELKSSSNSCMIVLLTERK